MSPEADYVDLGVPLAAERGLAHAHALETRSQQPQQTDARRFEQREHLADEIATWTQHGHCAD